MPQAHKAALCGLTTVAALAVGSAAARASSAQPGGTPAPAGAQAGGSEFGVPARASELARPVVSELVVPATAPAGRPPRVSLRIDEPGVSTVAVLVSVTDLTSRARVLLVSLGWVRTGRTITVRWPRGAALKAGSYRVSVGARDHRSRTLLRRAHASGLAGLTVLAPVAPPPKPSPPPTPSPAATEEGVPTPAQTTASGAVFPVAGPHSFGGPENRFGAPRANHIHQGQDVLSAEGTPILAPMAGTVLTTGYQAGGAGYYAVEHTAVFDFMFAHCQAESLAAATGQGVSAGQLLCRAGQTGDATTPHLHFEMWVGGWHASAASRPIDPLPYLEAWERPGG
ncbi:MAG TPA: M23 family metallopeptidase [Solirubrobacteraceae bacterium]|jgi:murein DD-endopeptidase MepM/ murein hydrolase activator NlpD|nr:M23 family metallopeptidase [Solirubrobacteraceae bacterium]